MDKYLITKKLITAHDNMPPVEFLIENTLGQVTLWLLLLQPKSKVLGEGPREGERLTSQCGSSVTPMPTAGPFTAAITTFGNRRSVSCMKVDGQCFK